MNKELIKKYKAEFNWWLDGGNVLYKVNGSNFNERSWLHMTDHNPIWGTNFTYIINDKYVEFRKALAEGKDFYFNHFGTWRKVSEFKASTFDCVWFKQYEVTEFSLTNPDEPKFKAGDYVVSKEYGTIQLTKTNVDSYNRHPQDIQDCKSSVYTRLWTLEEASDDEWVIELKKDSKVNGVACDLFTVMTAFTAKRLLRNKDVIVPYIGQSPKELGLE